MAMCEAKGFRPCERDELMTLVKGLQRQIAQLQGQNAQLAAANERLSKQLAELQRAGKRQAAPFSKGRRTSSPKRPGRKPGQGMFSYRKLPSPDQVTEPIVEVTVPGDTCPGDTCPGCGGRLEHEDISYPIDTKSSGIRGRWDLEPVDYEYCATWNGHGRTRKPTASRRRKPTSDRGNGGKAVQQGQVKGIDHRRPTPTTVASSSLLGWPSQ